MTIPAAHMQQLRLPVVKRLAEGKGKPRPPDPKARLWLPLAGGTRFCPGGTQEGTTRKGEGRVQQEANGAHGVTPERTGPSGRADEAPEGTPRQAEPATKADRFTGLSASQNHAGTLLQSPV